MDSLTIINIEPLQEPKVITIGNSLAALQKLVGGYLEMVPLSTDACMLINEEGIRLHLPPNRRFRSDVLLGNVLIVGRDGDEIVSLTPLQIQQYVEVFKTTEIVGPEEKRASSPFGFLF